MLWTRSRVAGCILAALAGIPFGASLPGAPAAAGTCLDALEAGCVLWATADARREDRDFVVWEDGVKRPWSKVLPSPLGLIAGTLRAPHDTHGRLLFHDEASGSVLYNVSQVDALPGLDSELQEILGDFASHEAAFYVSGESVSVKRYLAVPQGTQSAGVNEIEPLHLLQQWDRWVPLPGTASVLLPVTIAEGPGGELVDVIAATDRGGAVRLHGDSGDIQWTTQVPEFCANAMVADDATPPSRVFLAGRECVRDTGGMIAALDAESGGLLWFQHAARFGAQYAGGWGAWDLVGGAGRIYLVGSGPNCAPAVLAFDAGAGSLLWDFCGSFDIQGFWASPVAPATMRGESLFVAGAIQTGSGGILRGEVRTLAFNASTGSLLWTDVREGLRAHGIASTPDGIILQAGGNRGHDFLRAYDPHGTLLFEGSAFHGLPGTAATSILVDGAVAFVAGEREVEDRPHGKGIYDRTLHAVFLGPPDLPRGP